MYTSTQHTVTLTLKHAPKHKRTHPHTHTRTGGAHGRVPSLRRLQQGQIHLSHLQVALSSLPTAYSCIFTPMNYHCSFNIEHTTTIWSMRHGKRIEFTQIGTGVSKSLLTGGKLIRKKKVFDEFLGCL